MPTARTTQRPSSLLLLLLTITFLTVITSPEAKGQGVHPFCDPAVAGNTWNLQINGKAKFRDVVNALASDLRVGNIVPDYDVYDIDIEVPHINASWKSVLRLIMEQNGLESVCMEGGLLRIAKRGRLINSNEEQERFLTNVLTQPRRRILIKVFLYTISEKELNRLDPTYNPLAGRAESDTAGFVALLARGRSAKLVKVAAEPFGSVLEGQVLEVKAGVGGGVIVRVRPQLSSDSSGKDNVVTLEIQMKGEQSLQTVASAGVDKILVLGGGPSLTSGGGLFKRKKTETLFCALSAQLVQ